MATVDRPSIARRLAFWRLSDHSFVDDSQPAPFHFLAVGSKTVDRFGLAQTEAGWKMIRWSLDVLNLVTQERNRTLSFDILDNNSKMNQIKNMKPFILFEHFLYNFFRRNKGTCCSPAERHTDKEPAHHASESHTRPSDTVWFCHYTEGSHT